MFQAACLAYATLEMSSVNLWFFSEPDTRRGDCSFHSVLLQTLLYVLVNAT